MHHRKARHRHTQWRVARPRRSGMFHCTHPVTGSRRMFQFPISSATPSHTASQECEARHNGGPGSAARPYFKIYMWPTGNLPACSSSVESFVIFPHPQSPFTWPVGLCLWRGRRWGPFLLSLAIGLSSSFPCCRLFAGAVLRIAHSQTLQCYHRRPDTRHRAGGRAPTSGLVSIWQYKLYLTTLHVSFHRVSAWAWASAAGA